MICSILALLPLQLYLDKPLGIKFARGKDGAAYVVRDAALPQGSRRQGRRGWRGSTAQAYRGRCFLCPLDVLGPLAPPLPQSRSDPMLGNTSPEVAPGDKVVKVSASFGSDVWEALNFGQVRGCMRSRTPGSSGRAAAGPAPGPAAEDPPARRARPREPPPTHGPHLPCPRSFTQSRRATARSTFACSASMAT